MTESDPGQMICQARQEGRCKGFGMYSCIPHEHNSSCPVRWCTKGDSLIKEAVCVPVAPELWICDGVGECTAIKGKWCSAPFVGNAKIPGFDRTYLEASLWKNQPCEWTGLYVKAIPYRIVNRSKEKAMPKYEIAKEFTVFHWISAAREKGYDKCGDFKADLIWYLNTYRDMSLPIVMDDALAARLVKSPHMASHWLSVGFIREAGIEWKLEDLGSHYSLTQSTGWVALNIYKDGRGIRLLPHSGPRDFQTDSEGRIKIV